MPIKRTNSQKKKALIIGSTSEVAMALARKMLEKNYELILSGRKISRLHPFRTDTSHKLGANITLMELDLEKRTGIDALLPQAKDIDILISFVGYMPDNETAFHDFSLLNKTIQVNFTLQTEIFATFARAFVEKKQGQIVGVSSVAGMRGKCSNFVYGSAKAALSTYLDGLRGYLHSSGVTVLKVLPGFMDTNMTKNMSLPPWLTCSPRKAASIILKAIESKKDIVYVDWKWKLIMHIIRLLPEYIFKRLKL